MWFSWAAHTSGSGTGGHRTRSPKDALAPPLPPGRSRRTPEGPDVARGWSAICTVTMPRVLYPVGRRRAPVGRGGVFLHPDIGRRVGEQLPGVLRVAPHLVAKLAQSYA